MSVSGEELPPGLARRGAAGFRRWRRACPSSRVELLQLENLLRHGGNRLPRGQILRGNTMRRAKPGQGRNALELPGKQNTRELVEFSRRPLARAVRASKRCAPAELVKSKAMERECTESASFSKRTEIRYAIKVDMSRTAFLVALVEVEAHGQENVLRAFLAREETGHGGADAEFARLEVDVVTAPRREPTPTARGLPGRSRISTAP